MREKWLDWAIRIQSVAQSGLTYSKDKYDLERFQELRELSAEIMSDYTGIPEERIFELFCNENGEVLEIELQAVLTRRCQRHDWRTLQDDEHWAMGWK